MLARQLGLFGHEQPGIDVGFARLEHIPLDETAWVDYAPAWVSGHEALMDELARTTTWRHERRAIYDQVLDVPRLLATIPDDGPGHPLLLDLRRALEDRYACPLPHLTLALYRDGKDSVAFHGDRVAREMPEALVTTVSLGQPRTFVLKQREGGRRLTFALGWGDLIVMGGACQRTWLHGIPKVKNAGPRMVVMFRPSWYQDAEG
jgi:alkylated DNA repair dioxygenase AlkB